MLDRLKTISVVAAGAALFLFPRVGFAELKVAKVDFMQAVQTVEQGKAAKTRLEKDVASKKAEIERQEAAIKKEVEDYQKKEAILNNTAKAQKQAEIQKKMGDFQRNVQQSQMELAKAEQDAFDPVQKNLRDVINEFGKSSGYQLVIDDKAGGVLYAQNAEDKTQEVVSRYNKKFPAKK